MQNKTNYTIRTELKNSDLEHIHHALRNTYWAQSRSFEENCTAFSNSLAFILSDQNDNVVGFARVITDHVIFAYLADVYIDNNYRGQGLGKFLIHHILQDSKVSKIKKLMLKTNDAQKLYAKFGFIVPQNYESIMEKFNY